MKIDVDLEKLVADRDASYYERIGDNMKSLHKKLITFMEAR